ncbi:hypothetical protein MMC14_008381 [Varicellaria rhodocarpa]|nr:hypothetical protein [Varicellaria rhodocarpa]
MDPTTFTTTTIDYAFSPTPSTIIIATPLDFPTTNNAFFRPTTPQAVSPITPLPGADIPLPTIEEGRDPLEAQRETVLSMGQVMLRWQHRAEIAEKKWEFSEELLDEAMESLAEAARDERAQAARMKKVERAWAARGRELKDARAELKEARAEAEGLREALRKLREKKEKGKKKGKKAVKRMQPARACKRA